MTELDVLSYYILKSVLSCFKSLQIYECILDCSSCTRWQKDNVYLL